MIKNVVFDLGNTLLFFDHGIFYNNLALKEGTFSPAELKYFIERKKLADKLATGKLQPKSAYEIIKKKFNLKTGYREFCMIYANIFSVNIPMKKFLESLLRKNSHKLFLLSNTDRLHFNYIRKSYPFVMKIRNRILSYEVGAIKPGKKIYSYMLNNYRIKPRETCFIDDIHEHVEAAEKIGIKGILYSDHEKFLGRAKNLLN